MKKCFFFLFLFFFPLFVFADSGHSTIVMDINSGRVLYSNNIYEKKLIASTTKIMTFLVAFENSHLTDKITVGEEVLTMYGTNLYLQVGEILTVEDLLYGLMLRSGNDAAITLATQLVGEKEFIVKMNEKANEIGMKDTIFENPHGLDENTKNVSTAYDMALLSQYAFSNSFYRKVIGTKRYTTSSNLKSYVWYNRMSLLNQYSNCIGGKNGYTPNAGKTLVSYAKKNNRVFTIVSLDDVDLYHNHEMLYEEYFKIYQPYVIVDKKNFASTSIFFDGKVYLKDSFSYVLREEEVDDITTLIQMFPNSSRFEIGEVIIRLKNKVIGRIPIYQKEIKKEDKSIFQKIIDWIGEKN